MDGRTLYLKDGLKRVTHKNDSSQYLKVLGRADWIRTHLFPSYKTTLVKKPLVAPPRSKKTQAELTKVKEQFPAATETIEPVDLLQRTSDVDIAVKRLVDAATSAHDEDALPLRQLLGLDKAYRASVVLWSTIWQGSLS